MSYDIPTPTEELQELFLSFNLDSDTESEEEMASPENVLVLEEQKSQLFAEITTLVNECKSKLSSTRCKLIQLSLKRLESEWLTIKRDVVSTNATIKAAKDRVNVKDFGTIRQALDFIAITVIEHENHGESKALHLPKIQISTFDGQIGQWQAFIETFSSVIGENKTITNIHKINYLVSVLKGEPLAIVQQFGICETAYELAINALKKRYDSVRLLASYHSSQINNFKSQPFSASKFLETHRSAFTALRATLKEKLQDFLLFELAYRNVPATVQKSFELTQEPGTIPTLDELFDHVERVSRVDELKLHNQSSIVPSPKAALVKAKKTLLTTPTVSPEPSTSSKGVKFSCPFCKEAHKLYTCQQFKTLHVNERLDTIKRLNSCVNCLNYHPNKPCLSRFGCRTCGDKNHHTLLHVDKRNSLLTTFEEEPPTTAVCQHVSTLTGQVLLGTIKCFIQDNWGNMFTVRAIIDPGSEINIITESLVNKLKLPRRKATCDIQGINQKQIQSTGMVCAKIHAAVGEYQYNVNAVILRKICKPLPTRTASGMLPNHLQNLALADPECTKPGEIDLLLGCTAYADILLNEAPFCGQPTAVKTKFGWVLFGQLSAEPAPNENALTLLVKSEPLDQLLTKFWQLEEVKAPVNEDDECESQFLTTHSRDPDGRYVVQLPLNERVENLTCNKQRARVLFLRLERRLLAQPELREEYNKFMEDYAAQGHMTKTNSSSEYILPHHCVKKESTTTHVRVVFDASARDINGLSINDCQHTGPSYLRDIADIILNFRTHPYVITADIRQMYRQIKLDKNHRQFQHIYWRWKPTDPIQEYELNTITYGFSSAPFLAQRVLQQLAIDEGQAYPAAAYTIQHHSYMDDFASGSQSLKEAQELVRQLQELLIKAGFELRKWASNSAQVLKNLPHEHKEQAKKTPLGEGTKILGLFWNHKDDCFCYKTEPFNQQMVTKRTIASYVAKIFDVMGFLAPVTFKAKLFLQNLWLIKELSWDTALSATISSAWLSFVKQFDLLSSIRIPRHVPVATEFRLLGFSDASEKGKAPCVYLETKERFLYLLRAKTKLAPLKTQSVPRLELCAALLLANLLQVTKEHLKPLDPSIETLFSDSQIVLAWLKMEPFRLKTFVANRAVKILEVSKIENWHYVPGRYNPADMATRGLTPQQFQEAYSRWFNASDFLQAAFQPLEPLAHDDIPDQKSTATILTVSMNMPTLYDNLERFSSYTKLIRTYGYVLRAINMFRKRFHERGPLTIDEIKSSEITVVRLVQEQHYEDTIKRLTAGKLIPKQLRHLTPFIENGLLRAGGRLNNAKLPITTKQPLILQKGCQLSKLIATHTHELCLHAGPKTTLSLIQRAFWIQGGHSLVKSVIHRCIKCHRLNAKPIAPLMGQLPRCRVQPSRPFDRCSVDFAGPLTTKETTRRRSPNHKSYLCAFVCMATRAVHIEVVSDLSTSAFLAALERFIARRNAPSEILSDNGRNFLGAARKLNRNYEMSINRPELVDDYLVRKRIKWTFAPPYSPHFNGLCEAVVKSAKNLLIRQVGRDILTFEELTTQISKQC